MNRLEKNFCRAGYVAVAGGFIGAQIYENFWGNVISYGTMLASLGAVSIIKHKEQTRTIRKHNEAQGEISGLQEQINSVENRLEAIFERAELEYHPSQINPEDN